MGNLAQGIDALAMLPTDERLKALQRVLPRSQVDEVLAETGLPAAVETVGIHGHS